MEFLETTHHYFFYQQAMEQQKVYISNADKSNYTLLKFSHSDGTDFIALSSSAITFASSSRIDSLNILIISGSSTEDSEVFTVTLDAVILTHAGNDTILNLSEEERARLIKNPRMANVTIIDNNGNL